MACCCKENPTVNARLYSTCFFIGIIYYLYFVCMYAGHFVAVVIIFMISLGYLNAFVCILAGL